MVIIGLGPQNRIWQGIAGTIQDNSKTLNSFRNVALAETAAKKAGSQQGNLAWAMPY